MNALRGALVALLLLGLLAPAALVQASSTNHTPTLLKVATVPPVLPADSSSYPALVVSVADGSGSPTLSLTDITVYLSSSNASIVSVPSTVTLEAGQGFVQVPVTTSDVPGSVTLAATSAGLRFATVGLKTAVPASAPSALELYFAPSPAVTSLSGSDVAYAVQAVNAAGKPALPGSETSLVITSSNGSVLGGTIQATIPRSSDVVFGEFAVTAAGTSTFTALAPELATGSTVLNVRPAAPKLVVTASVPFMTISDTASVTVSATVLGMPVPGLAVAVTSSQGTLVPGGTFFLGSDGTTTMKFLPSDVGSATITVESSSSLLGNLSGKVTITVAPQSTSTASGGQSGFPALGGLSLYIPVIVIAVVVLVGYALIRTTLRKRKATPEDEYQPPEGQS